MADFFVQFFYRRDPSLMTLCSLALYVLVVTLHTVIQPGLGPLYPDKTASFKTANITGTCQETIPKLIWTYWSDDSLPPLIGSCIVNWKRQNPDYIVQVITPKNMKRIIATEIPDFFHRAESQYQADWIRLAVLKERGGIWLDASIILTSSLNYILDIQQAHKTQGFMYFLDYWTVDINFPVFETWMIAVVPKSQTVEKWFTEYNHCFTKHEAKDSYILELKEKYGRRTVYKLSQNIRMLWYVKTNLALQKVMQIDGAQPFYGLSAECEEEAAPLSLQVKNGWDSEKTAQMIVESWNKALPTPKIIKLRSGERNSVIKLLESKKAAPDSLYTMYLASD